MRTLVLVAVLLVAASATGLPGRASSSPRAPRSVMKKITPLITVDAIEPCLPFWTDRFGFEVTVTVPHEDSMGFAILARDELQLMYQSRASVEADLGEVGAGSGHPDLAEDMATGMSTLFIEVEALDPVLESLGEDADVVVPRRQTFYGMDEVFVQAPCGTLVGFAAAVEGGGDDG